jgi:hypothetical protein
MEKLGLGIVVLICALLLGCIAIGQPTARLPVPAQQTDKLGGDGGGGGM